KSHSHVNGLCIGTLELPGQVMPGKGCRGLALDIGVPPGIAGRIPDVPDITTLDIALGTKNKLEMAVRLIHIEFERLSEPGRCKGDIQVILKVSGIVFAAQLFPPESV